MVIGMVSLMNIRLSSMDKRHRLNDPYAKAMLANSEKSVIVDSAKTDHA